MSGLSVHFHASSERQRQLQAALCREPEKRTCCLKTASPGVHTQSAAFAKPENKQNDALLRQMQESNTHMAPGSDPTVVETHAAETVLELELSGGFADAV